MYDFHREHGHMTEYANFDMPVWFKGTIPEALAVRNAVGIFDVSHMGRLLISGEEAAAFLNMVTTRDASPLDIGQGAYGFLCNEQGGIKDDIIFMKLQPQLFYMVFNASNREKDLHWLQENSTGFKVKLDHISDRVALIAVQGPRAQATLQKICEPDPATLKRYWCRWVTLDGLKCLLARTGYTGEDGFEVAVWDTPVEEPSKALKIWNRIMEAGKEFGIEPCGLGVRDVLRLEHGMPLYGNDLDEETTPLEAKLNFAVTLSKEKFIGKDALLRQKAEGLKRIRIGLKAVERGIPRAGYEVKSDEKVVGKVTSGTFSPLLNYGIAMGYVPPEYSKLGSLLEIQIRNRALKAEIVDVPFYDATRFGWRRKTA